MRKVCILICVILLVGACVFAGDLGFSGNIGFSETDNSVSFIADVEGKVSKLATISKNSSIGTMCTVGMITDFTNINMTSTLAGTFDVEMLDMIDTSFIIGVNFIYIGNFDVGLLTEYKMAYNVAPRFDADMAVKYSHMFVSNSDIFDILIGATYHF